MKDGILYEVTELVDKMYCIQFPTDARPKLKDGTEVDTIHFETRDGLLASTIMVCEPGADLLRVTRYVPVAVTRVWRRLDPWLRKVLIDTAPSTFAEDKVNVAPRLLPAWR